MKKSIILGVAAAFCYSAMLFLVKLIASHANEIIIIFFRFAVGLFWVLLVLGYKLRFGKPLALKTKHLGLHLVRASSALVSLATLYLALQYISLVDANLLSMTYTLFIPILSFLFLGTKTSAKNWFFLVLGFVGIVFILKPGYGIFEPAMVLALIAGLSIAASFLGVHELAKDDDPCTILFYCFLIIFIVSGILSVFNWQPLNLNTVFVLLLIGIVGTAYQELLTRALSCASPKIVSPLLYLSVIFSGFLGWFAWGHVPDLFFLIGMILVIIGCVFSIISADESSSSVL